MEYTQEHPTLSFTIMTKFSMIFLENYMLYCITWLGSNPGDVCCLLRMTVVRQHQSLLVTSSIFSIFFVCLLIQVSKDMRYADDQPIVSWGPRYFFSFQFNATEHVFHIPVLCAHFGMMHPPSHNAKTSLPIMKTSARTEGILFWIICKITSGCSHSCAWKSLCIGLLQTSSYHSFFILWKSKVGLHWQNNTI
jgi:hypothetical protein